METSNVFSGEIKQILGNQPILLDPSNYIYYVKSGEVSLFTSTVENRVLISNRYYLFTATTGDILFGTNNQSDYSLLGIAIGKAEIIPISHNHFSQLIKSSDPIAIKAVEKWITNLSRIFRDLTPPKQVKIIDSLPEQQLETRTQFQQGESLRFPQICWLQLNQGKIQWMNQSEITIQDNSHLIPLVLNNWINCLESIDCQIYTTETLTDWQTLQTGINQYAHLVTSYVAILEKKAIEQAKLRLQAREEQNQYVGREALQDLTSILQNQHQEYQLQESGNDLLKAMGAIGRYLGVKIHPPAKSEDISRAKNPLDPILRASNLRMRRVLLTAQWWFYDCGALLAYQENKIPVALIPVGNKKYRLFDPAENKKTIVNAQIAEQLLPEAFMFYSPFPDKSLKTWDIWQFALRGRLPDLFLILLSAISATLLNMLIPVFTGKLINDVIPNSEKSLLLQMGFVLFASTLGIGFFRLTQGFTLLRLETASDAPLQSAIWDRVLKLKTDFFRQYSTGDLTQRISGITQIRSQLSGSTLNTILSSLFALLNLGLMLYYSRILALAALIITIIAMIITSIHGWLIVRQYKPLLALEGKLFGIVVQMINGVSKLRVAGAETRAFAYWAKRYRERSELTLKVQIISNSLDLVNQIISPISTIIIFWLAIWLITGRQSAGIPTLGIGSFMAFNAAFGTFMSSSVSLSNTAVDSLNILNLWERAKPIIEAEPETDLQKVDPGKLSGHLKIDHVTFRYKPDTPIILHDITLEAKPGEFIALVGSSGSGKSTILRLLLGFETPELGEVYYDDQELSKLNLQAVRRQLGVVMQNGRLLSGSIFENISGNALITLDEAWEASRMAGLAADIEAMPMKMHTVISEGGGNLSGGQKQRLMIAKALVLKPKIIFFDEATSALDNKTQEIVTHSLDQLRATRVVIAHRLSTVRHADRIYVIDKGHVVEQGKFSDLVKNNGLFSQLMKRQMT